MLQRRDEADDEPTRSDESPSGAKAESPSLAHRGAGVRSYELKLLLSEEQAVALERRLATALRVDPHATRGGGAYEITTLYCDTPAGDVAAGRGRHGRRKLRVRRYGAEESIFLERKRKRGDRVRKLRSSASLRELAWLAPLANPPSSWPGAWFAELVRRDELRPVCRLAYSRRAYFGVADELGGGPLRLTFDRELRGSLVADWTLDSMLAEARFLDGRVIGELKFQSQLPRLFKSALEELELLPTRVSKFRHCLAALGRGAAASPGEV